MEEGQYLRITVPDHGIQENEEGSKQYVLYEVHVETNLPEYPATATVHRRFNEFLWLYSRLKDEWMAQKERADGIEKPAKHPPKQAIGRWKADFIEKRKQKLEEWIKELIAHPVWVTLPCFRLFFTEPNMVGVYRH
eukprot:TRINITY_DN1160_c0_g1_i1.p1 TRINITY_DN1160_c0_g1~~TRINITY_DN1160_c0_g1_i1.p1  ORF type:complete len:136 (+),score=45.48 TRINITY_DN1160_c0_g1_i1:231-638(+)